MSLSAKQQLSRTLAADYDAWLAGQSVPSALYSAPPVVKDMRILVAAPRPVKPPKPAKVFVPKRVKAAKPAKRVRPKAPPKVVYRDGKQVAALAVAADLLRYGPIDSRPLLYAIMTVGLSEDSARHFIGRWVKKGVLIEHPFSACRGFGRVVGLAEHVGVIGAVAELAGHRDASDFFSDWLPLIGQDWVQASQLPRQATIQVMVTTLKNMVGRGLLESSYRPNNRNQIVMHYRLSRV